MKLLIYHSLFILAGGGLIVWSSTMPPASHFALYIGLLGVLLLVVAVVNLIADWKLFKQFK